MCVCVCYEEEEKQKLIFLRVIEVKISQMVIEELLFCRPRFDRIIERLSYQRTLSSSLVFAFKRRLLTTLVFPSTSARTCGVTCCMTSGDMPARSFGHVNK